MTSARTRALLLAAALLIAAAAIAFVRMQVRAPNAPAPAQRPTLLLLTSLPLVLPEQFTLEGSGSPVLSALKKGYHVFPISTTAPAELRKGRLLLMAQPIAQTAENLVALDDWVRRGGRVLLLADPMLEWPSARPLGDPLRPPPMFMDTGLLQHWGLRLDAPDRRGIASRKLGGKAVVTASPGALACACAISSDRLVAQCRIGKGEATIVADADLLDVDRLGAAASRNLDGLLGELARLARQ